MRRDPPLVPAYKQRRHATLSGEHVSLKIIQAITAALAEHSQGRAAAARHTVRGGDATAGTVQMIEEALAKYDRQRRLRDDGEPLIADGAQFARFLQSSGEIERLSQQTLFRSQVRRAMPPATPSNPCWRRALALRAAAALRSIAWRLEATVPSAR